MKSYHNTTGEQQNLPFYSFKASRQDLVALEYMKRVGKATASQVWRFGFKESIPLTSVRRAISNLTKADRLFKTEKKAVGIYGRPETYYQFNHRFAVSAANVEQAAGNGAVGA